MTKLNETTFFFADCYDCTFLAKVAESAYFDAVYFLVSFISIQYWTSIFDAYFQMKKIYLYFSFLQKGKSKRKAMEKKRRHRFCHLLPGIMSLAAITHVISSDSASAITSASASVDESSGSEPNVADWSPAAACKATSTSTQSSCNLPQVGEIKKKFDFTQSQKSAKIREIPRDRQLVASLPVPSDFSVSTKLTFIMVI